MRCARWRRATRAEVVRLREGGYRQVERHSIAAEREAFGALLQTVEELTPASPRYGRSAVSAAAAAAVPTSAARASARSRGHLRASPGAAAPRPPGRRQAVTGASGPLCSGAGSSAPARAR